MGRWTDFLEKLFPTKETIGGETVIITIPPELYYKELALQMAISLISNAISRSEIKTYAAGKEVKERDYYLLNCSPNRNETSSYFWHKVINTAVRKKEALIIDAGGYLYCADAFVRKQEQPVNGDVFEGVTVGNFSFNRVFTQKDIYLIRLEDKSISSLIDGMYEDYGTLLAAAARQFRLGSGQKYKLHIEGVKTGDEEFQKEFDEYIKDQLKTYMEAENAVYPEFEGYQLEADPNKSSSSSSDFLNLRKDLFQTVASAFHIPESMMTGNITSMKDVVGAFLTFGVDPWADCITEALNKAGGVDNYISGNRYRVDTGKIMHRSVFDDAVAISNLISSGFMCIDETREEMGREPLNTEWSQKHFITKNFEEIEKYLTNLEKGGE